MQQLGRRIALLCGLSFLVAGCSGTRPVQSHVLLNHKNCQTLKAGITEVGVERVATIRGSRLLQDPSRKQLAESARSPGIAPLTDATRVFAVSKGMMPTPGYRFELDHAALEDTTLTLALHWRTPAPDTVLPQVQTHPCVVIALPVDEAKTLIVQDTDGELGRIEL